MKPEDSIYLSTDTTPQQLSGQSTSSVEMPGTRSTGCSGFSMRLTTIWS